MTTIVAIKEAGRIVMGGDSAGCSTTGIIELRSDPKVFTRDGYLIGYTTSFRMGQILRFCIQWPEPPVGGDIHAFMVQTVIPTIRDGFIEHGFGKTLRIASEKDGKQYDESGQAGGGQFLVGVAGELFLVHHDFQVGIPRLGYVAIGSGAQVATGVLYATTDQAPHKRIESALQGAAEHTSCVRQPWIIEELD